MEIYQTIATSICSPGSKDEHAQYVLDRLNRRGEGRKLQMGGQAEFEINSSPMAARFKVE